MQQLPLVTIGAFNYNNARFVVETLDSIDHQTYQNIEFIIVDDCSTDDSVKIIQDWIRKATRPCVFYPHTINKGFYFRLNEVINQAKGKYFSLIATDDVMMLNKTEEQVNLAESKGKDVGMVYGDCMMIDEKGAVIYRSMFEHNKGVDFIPPSGDIFKYIVEDFYFYTQASLLNLRALLDIKFTFNEKVISEDWDLELAISRNYKIYSINKVFTKYRKVSTSMTAINWSPEKHQLVLKSHFYMFYKYLDNPLNTKEDKGLILKKLKLIFWSYLSSKNKSYNTYTDMSFKIFIKSKNIRDLYKLTKLILRAG